MANASASRSAALVSPEHWGQAELWILKCQTSLQCLLCFVNKSRNSSFPTNWKMSETRRTERSRDAGLFLSTKIDEECATCEEELENRDTVTCVRCGVRLHKTEKNWQRRRSKKKGSNMRSLQMFHCSWTRQGGRGDIRLLSSWPGKSRCPPSDAIWDKQGREKTLVPESSHGEQRCQRLSH